MKQKSEGAKRTIRRGIWRAACILFALYVAACLGCAAFQRRMLYYPTNQSPAACERVAQSRALERWKNSAGENIGWKRSATRQPAFGQLLITHGNGGCAMDRGDFAAPLRESAAMDVFILEYPGFGDRAGVPSQKSLFDAAEEAFQSLPKAAPVYLLGESLGTGVAAHLAGTHPNEIAGILLFAPYNTLTDVAQHHVRILPARWLMVDHFPSGEYLSHYRGPLAVVIGGKDRVIPEKFGRRLFDGYAGPKRLWEMPQGTHETIQLQGAEFWKEVGIFWQANATHAKRFD